MKSRVFSSVGSLLLAAALSIGASPVALADDDDNDDKGKGPPAGLDCPDGQNIVVHLKRHINDLQGAQIAIRLATVLESQELSEGRPDNVTVFLTLQGPRLIDPANPQDLVFGSAPETLEQVVEGFLAAGGTIYACPLCATEIGLNPGDELLYEDDYPDQVKIAGGPDIVKTFLCAHKVLDF